MTSPRKLRVLFVDDEGTVLDGLRRQFYAFRDQAECRFALSHTAALEALRDAPADVVVTDMQMHGGSGTELLRRVRDLWPQTVRIILSGQTDQANLLYDVGVIHQFVQKPCLPETLRDAILRTTALARRVEVPSLHAAVGGMRSLPILGDHLKRFLRAVDAKDADVARISLEVSRDVGLSTKLLQLINSAFFGRPRRVTSVREAVSLLGITNLRALALTARTFETLGDDDATSPRIESLWRASVDVGALAAGLARNAGQSTLVQEQSQLAGMLSLVGRAILCRHDPARFAAAVDLAVESGVCVSDGERSVFGVSQEDLGAYALGLWAFDDAIIRAVAFQRNPAAAGVTSPADPLVFIHAARSSLPPSGLVDAPDLSTSFIESLALSPDLLRPTRHAA
jgi:HD-like signal output (HDOD) protein/CheY-like chemotaxis protein